MLVFLGVFTKQLLLLFFLQSNFLLQSNFVCGLPTDAIYWGGWLRLINTKRPRSQNQLELGHGKHKGSRHARKGGGTETYILENKKKRHERMNKQNKKTKKHGPLCIYIWVTLEGRRVTGKWSIAGRSGRMPLLLIRAFALVRETPARPAHQACDPCPGYVRSTARNRIASHACRCGVDGCHSIGLARFHIYILADARCAVQCVAFAGSNR